MRPASNSYTHYLRFLLLLFLFSAVLFPAADIPAASLFEKPTEGESTPGPRYIYLTHSADEDSFTHQAAQIFKETLERESDGRFCVRIFPNDTFGTVDEADYSLANGSVQMRIGSGPCNIIWMLSYRFMTGLDIPGLRAAMENEKLQSIINEDCAKYGVKILGILPASYRVMTSNKEVRCADDFRGMRLRMYDADNSIQYWVAQGAEVKVFSFSEVYGALQSGLIDGNPEVTLQDVISRRFYEQQKYVIDIRQQIYNEAIYVNLDFYEGLSSEDQALLEKAVAEMNERSAPILEKNLEDAKKILADAGVTWIDLPQEDQDMLMARGKAVMLPAMKEVLGEDLLKQLTSVLEEISG